jgi:hypothetical protein
MRLVRLVSLYLPLLGVPLLLSACGGHSNSAPTLSVSCNGSLVLAGASSIDVTYLAGKSTMLSFPDPANPGHVGSLPVSDGQPCTITPSVNKADKPGAS